MRNRIKCHRQRDPPCQARSAVSAGFRQLGLHAPATECVPYVVTDFDGASIDQSSKPISWVFKGAGRKPTSNTEQQWWALLEKHIDGTIGAMPVGEVAATDIVTVLDRVWDRPELARRTARRISTTMKWAMGRGLRETDPTAAAVAAMPKHRRKPQHRRAVHHSEMPQVLDRVRASGATAAAKLSFELLVLTAARPAEVRFADWAEFNLDEALWVIPASRYKTGVEHRVPLSDRAVSVLAQARDLTGSDGLVFVSETTARALSNASWNKLLRTLGIDMTSHGARSCFRSWCSDTGVPRDLAEVALGHAVRDSTEAAYARSDMIERRYPLMQTWADHIKGPITTDVTQSR